MNIRDIQNALANTGFDPGPVDGVMGPKTRKAIRAFQAVNGLEVDGVVGPNTRGKLFPGAPPKPASVDWIPTELPWMVEGARHAGLKEIPGPANDPTIMNWAASLNAGGYSSDEVPWCGLFVGHCISSQLDDESIPTNFLGARKWENFGQPTQPCFGSVLVFWRVKKNGRKGHVGFYWAEDNTHFHVLGGNQSNKVSVKRIHKKTRFLQARWPTTSTAGKFIRTGDANGVGISLTEQ